MDIGKFVALCRLGTDVVQVNNIPHNRVRKIKVYPQIPLNNDKNIPYDRCTWRVHQSNRIPALDI